jgi:hypothetical protein
VLLDAPIFSPFADLPRIGNFEKHHRTDDPFGALSSM